MMADTNDGQNWQAVGVDYLKENHPLAEFLEDFPGISRDQALAVLEVATELVVGVPAFR